MSKQEKNDSIKVTGTFHCKVFENGTLIQEYTDKNMVVQLGLNYLAQMLAGETGVIPLTKIGVGTRTTAPDMGDTHLTPMLFIRPLTVISYLGSGTVQLEWQIDPGEANSITIAEFGLLFNDHRLFARKTGLTVAKNNTISLAGTWTINFS